MTSVFNGVTYVHTLASLATSQSDGSTGSFNGTGGIDSLGLFNENITGTLAGQNINISGVYPTSYASDPGYTWSYSGPLNGGGTYADSHGNQVAISFAVNTTNFKNHGDYVSSSGGGNDAAHSCIGMPIH